MDMADATTLSRPGRASYDRTIFFFDGLNTNLIFSCFYFSDSYFVGGGRVVRRCWVNFHCQGVLLIWITVGQGPIVLAIGAGCLDFFLSSISSLFFLPLSGRRPDID